WLMCACACCLVFFAPPRALRHPHSFPTRRSSDLENRSSAANGFAAEITSRAHAHHIKQAGGECRESIYLRWVLHENESNESDTGDRKSTRLNSSHLVISYAVFCLKKKKHIAHNYS